MVENKETVSAIVAKLTREIELKRQQLEQVEQLNNLQVAFERSLDGKVHAAD